MPPWDSLTSGKVKIEVDPSMAGRVEYVLDLGCGTATSASLYYLLYYPSSIVIGIDRDCNREWVESHLPEPVRRRFFFVPGDVGKLTIWKVEEHVARHMKIPLSRLTRVHWSPCCRGLSDASRGFHRDSMGNPLTDLARRDDAIFEHGVSLVKELSRIAAGLQCTIENPVSNTFPHLPGVRKLLRDPQWRLLAGSHCSNLCSADSGKWPQKDTYYLMNKVPRKFHLDLCDFDCRHLIEHTDRHELVLCNNSSNLEDQVVISDPYMKGLIPLGVFRKIDLAHRKWCARRDGRRARAGLTVLTPSGEIAGRSVGAVQEQPDPADSDSDTDQEDDSDSESDVDYDEDEPIDESQFDENGLRIPEQCQPLRTEIPLPRVPLADSHVAEHAMCYPALQQGQPRWQVKYLMPWALVFADLITFDFRVRGNKAHLLVVYDLVTDGVRVRPVKRKAEIGDEWDKLVTMESLHLRPHKVTVVTDGCGAMHGILADRALRRGIDHMPIPPYQPHLNNVEGIVGSFKADVACCLKAACVEGGPIHEAYVMACSEYVAYTRERFVPRRTIDALKSAGRSRFELNTGVPARPGLVPFGTAGFAFVPAEMRKRRGAPKYERSEPVLCVGYQHMYTVVYKCLTRHNTIIHSEQVRWDLDAPLGVFLSTEPGGPVSKEASPKPSMKDIDVFAEKASRPSPKENSEKPKRQGSSLPSGILRINKDKFFDAEGNPRPKKYISDRVKAVEGLTVAEAVVLEFPDKHGKLQKYRRDIFYDLFTQKWTRLENGPPAAAAAANASQTGLRPEEANEEGEAFFDAEEPAPSCFFKSVYDTGEAPAHPDGVLGDCLNRHHRRCVRRCMHRAARRTLRRTVRAPVRLPRVARAHRRMANLRAFRVGASRSHEHADIDPEIDGTPGFELYFDAPEDPAEPYSSESGPYRMTDDEIRHAYNIAMRDLPWKPYLEGKEVQHREDVLRAYHLELNSLLSTVLREVKEGDAEWDAARANHTTCRALLEWKRQGLWKCRVVIQGHKENKLALDGPDFEYASDVVGLTAIRALFLKPLQKGEAIGQLDISTAFLQSDMFKEDEPPRYLMLPDPVTGTKRYFRQLGVVYGSASSPKRWQDTLNGWLVKPEKQGGGGYVQGKNDPCMFYHPRLEVALATYVDDMAVRGQRPNAEKAFEAIQNRFKCKDVHWLGVGSPLDHLGMTFFQDEKATYLSMENYIEAMVTRLEVDVDRGRHDLPMSGPITDHTPLSRQEARWYMSATGMIGWLAGTGRPDLKLSHSRIASYMANPCRGALRAVLQAVRYCWHHRHLCLHSCFGGDLRWVHYSDSDHAGNAEPNARRKSQLGYISLLGTAPIGWGSKGTSVNFQDRLQSIAEISNPSRNSPTPGKAVSDPACHSALDQLHPDVSSGAAEIYAASVALTEVLHLSYIVEEMGDSMGLPLEIKVDNTTAIAFSKGNVRRSKLKHIDVRQSWVEWLRDKSLVNLSHVDTKLNLADFFTKLLDLENFTRLRSMMMVDRPIDLALRAGL